MSSSVFLRIRHRLGHFRRQVRILFKLAHQARNPAQFPKYLPAFPDAENYALNYEPSTEDESLPVPPPELWLNYATDEAVYLGVGEKHTQRMLTLAPLPKVEEGKTSRVLDLGCGGGRMIRHLRAQAATHEIWGLDISARHINWLKTHLSPPFRFATNTTIPHLPFADGSFDYIYTGSVFTHIEDWAESWFLEVARVMRPGGTFYCTLHDEHTAKVIVRDNDPLARLIDNNPELESDITVIGRDAESNVFYRARYLKQLLEPLFEILRVEPEAYSYQTAWILRRR